ncbi:poly-gamma-glutamate biosynthesis protein PgsC/CapC [Marinobacter sp. SS21]|uniref:poly-gamma-glutamate biosynthesis protein PgsC/CapC n=1 Tax=Marinobacter sp. SS21 TaxID=2979460 RepID=UPI00232E9918|nr:poly-gamma-glutamate biosynthesis protein PgsC/CapC [Marinobacter sp. SS21]MDC0662938.1 poly-gamma-glutamate biosynthesis protein PgsC/CapC [Marinobacter sp. SS21]
MIESLFPLQLFPTGGLSSSVITTVWVGVCVVAFLNLRFGTTLSGLVVPGYLIPLLIVRPISGFVVLFEGLVTYLLARLLAQQLPKALGYAELFGRDRFFALVLLSIIVRLAFDGAAFPWLEELLAERGYDYSVRNNLHSFGLIVVALIANQFWNGGLRFGASALVLYLGITYVLVRFVLMEFTNFNINTLSYMYEDLASSILASPKAYIILLTSAFLASRMNLRYGWEYNGILVPSLLALQWYQPAKLLATFVETFVIYFLARLLLTTPALRHRNIEGARLLLLFFTISFIYKIVLGFALIEWQPEHKITDYYGFGYLLATLMALKMHQKDVAALVTRASLQTSLVAVLAASAIGFALTLLPSGHALIGTDNLEPTVTRVRVEQPLNYVHQRYADLYDSEQNRVFKAPSPIELDQIETGFRALRAFTQQGTEAELQRAASLLNPLQFHLERVNEQLLAVYDAQPERGWGAYFLHLEPDSQLLLQVPAPLDEGTAAEAGIWMFLQDRTRALAMPGTRRFLSPDGAGDALLNPATVFQAFHRVFAEDNVLQLRGYTPATARPLFGLRDTSLALDAQITLSTLWVTRSLPSDLNLKGIKQRTEQLEIHWQPSPLNNRQRDAVQGGFAELFISAQDLRSWIAYGDVFELTTQRQQERIDGYLQRWLGDNKALIAGAGTNRYVAPDIGTLVFFDQLVLSPLFELIHADLPQGWDDRFERRLIRLSILARSQGYRISRYQHIETGANYLILEPEQTPGKPARYWGIYVFRLGPASPLMVQVPHPLYELNTFEFGSTFFEDSGAGVLMISGTHPHANADGSADVSHPANQQSLFNLVSQVWQRELRAQPMEVAQIRALGSSWVMDQSSADVLVSSYYGLHNQQRRSLIESSLRQLGLTVAPVEGKPETLGYETSLNAQSLYLRVAENKDVTSLWLTPDTRRLFRSQENDRQQLAKFRAANIASQQGSLPAFVERHGSGQASRPALDSLMATIRAYQHSENISFLHTLGKQHPDFEFTRLVDLNTQQAFITVHGHQKRVVLIANLRPSSPQIRHLPTATEAAAGDTVRQATRDFIGARDAFLVTQEEKQK